MRDQRAVHYHDPVFEKTKDHKCYGDINQNVIPDLTDTRDF